jgi:uncharacterized protein
VQTRREPTLDELRARRQEILQVAASHGATNVCIFGSVARGEADPSSDVDMLVDISADARGLAYFGLLDALQRDLSHLLGREVDVVDRAALRTMREAVLREAISL